MKGAKVYTNDPASPLANLTLKIFAKAPIRLLPFYVSFYGLEDQTMTIPLEVKGEANRPLALKVEEFSLKDKVNYRLEEKDNGQGYKLFFTNIAGPPEFYRGHITLRTNYPEKPVIQVRITGRFVKKETLDKPSTLPVKKR